MRAPTEVAPWQETGASGASAPPERALLPCYSELVLLPQILKLVLLSQSLELVLLELVLQELVLPWSWCSLRKN